MYCIIQKDKVAAKIWLVGMYLRFCTLTMQLAARMAQILSTLKWSKHFVNSLAVFVDDTVVLYGASDLKKC